MASAQRAEFEDWHSHEHLPERLGIPGFQRGSRWASATGGEGFFVMYELDRYETLTSTEYLGRLNQPTPWSVKMMPHHRNMVRSQCRIAASHGGGIGNSMLTMRLSPSPGRADELREKLDDALARVSSLPGLSGGHLLETRTPDAPPTTEQRIRGGADAAADWIVLVSGYDAQAIERIASGAIGPEALAAAGARSGAIAARYGLRYTLTAMDVPAAAQIDDERRRGAIPVTTSRAAGKGQ
ncbi:MAG: hypothetical protein ABI831_21365 [Betaproteobacteria bacterium]